MSSDAALQTLVNSRVLPRNANCSHCTGLNLVSHLHWAALHFLISLHVPRTCLHKASWQTTRSELALAAGLRLRRLVRVRMPSGVRLRREHRRRRLYKRTWVRSKCCLLPISPIWGGMSSKAASARLEGIPMASRCWPSCQCTLSISVERSALFIPKLLWWFVKGFCTGENDWACCLACVFLKLDQCGTQASHARLLSRNSCLAKSSLYLRVRPWQR